MTTLGVSYGTVPVTTLAKLEGMKILIFNSLYPIWRKKLLPKIQISMCREVVSIWSYTSFSGEEVSTRTKKRQIHQGISHVDPLAPGTAWEASWCTVGRLVEATTTPSFNSSKCNWTARSVILQPPDSQYWNINSWLKTWEKTLCWGFNWRESPSPIWTLLNGNQYQKGLETISSLSHAPQASWI